MKVVISSALKGPLSSHALDRRFERANPLARTTPASRHTLCKSRPVIDR